MLLCTYPSEVSYFCFGLVLRPDKLKTQVLFVEILSLDYNGGKDHGPRVFFINSAIIAGGHILIHIIQTQSLQCAWTVVVSGYFVLSHVTSSYIVFVHCVSAHFMLFQISSRHYHATVVLLSC